MTKSGEASAAAYNEAGGGAAELGGAARGRDVVEGSNVAVGADGHAAADHEHVLAGQPHTVVAQQLDAAGRGARQRRSWCIFGAWTASALLVYFWRLHGNICIVILKP